MAIRPRRRLDKPALFDALGYRPHPGQRLVHRSTAKRRVLCCGVRWGKSTCAAMECIAALFELRESARGWVVAPTYDLASRIFGLVVQTIQTHMPHRILELDARTQRIVVANFAGGQSELRAKSADNPTSLLGEALDFVVLDEAASMDGSIWEEHIAQRLLDRDGWALLISTPKGYDWFSRLFRRGQRGRDAAFESWTSPSWENPFLSRKLIEEEKTRLNEDVFAEKFAAEFVGDDDWPCDTCGGPAYGLPTVIFAPKEGDFAECSDCGEMVDAAGRTLVARYADGRRATMTIIHFRPRTDGSPTPPPMRCVPDIDSKPRAITSDDLQFPAR